MNRVTGKHSACAGFTIVELVVALVVSTIVVGFVMLFMTTPVDAYFAQARRAELIIEADLIKRNINSDVRSAVPNSIRVVNAGTIKILEMLYATDVASYRKKNTTSPSTPTDELDFTVADGAFSTYGQFHRGASLSCAGFRLVIGQDQSLPTTNAYAGAQVITPSASSVTCPSVVGKANVTITPGFKFAALSPTSNVFVVSGSVAYVCDQTAHTLTRYFNYQIANGIAVNRNAAATIGVISQDINICNFTNAASTSYRGDLVRINIQLQRVPTTETLTTMIQSPVESLP